MTVNGEQGAKPILSMEYLHTRLHHLFRLSRVLEVHMLVRRSNTLMQEDLHTFASPLGVMWHAML